MKVKNTPASIFFIFQNDIRLVWKTTVKVRTFPVGCVASILSSIPCGTLESVAGQSACVGDFQSSSPLQSLLLLTESPRIPVQLLWITSSFCESLWDTVVSYSNTTITLILDKNVTQEGHISLMILFPHSGVILIVTHYTFKHWRFILWQELNAMSTSVIAENCVIMITWRCVVLNNANVLLNTSYSIHQKILPGISRLGMAELNVEILYYSIFTESNIDRGKTSS